MDIVVITESRKVEGWERAPELSLGPQPAPADAGMNGVELRTHDPV